MGEIISTQRCLSLIASVLVVQANPTDSTEQDENAKSDSPSCCSQVESPKKEDGLPLNDTVHNNTESIDNNTYYQETASAHDRFVPLSSTHEYRSPCGVTRHEYGIPGPPDNHTEPTPENLRGNKHRYTWNADSRLMQTVPVTGELNQSFSDKFRSLSINPGNGNHLTQNTWQDVPETSSIRTAQTLSTDDLSVDARTCRQPGQLQRNVDNDGGQSKIERNAGYSIAFEKSDAKAQDEKKENSKGKRSHQLRNTKMEAFIRQLVAQELNQPPRKTEIIMFDAAIVYDKSDYDEVIQFRKELIAIVRNKLGEDLQLELFDSEVFAQSKVMVIEDVINKCSIVLIYLTKNCTSETFKLFVEEGIGISRLALNNPDIQAGKITNDKQWVMRPVHTQPLKHRHYHTPIGLVTLNGIDWYDKQSNFTQDQIACIMHEAITRRKRDEGLKTTIPSYSDVPQMTPRNSFVAAEPVIPNIGNSNISTSRPAHQGVQMTQHHSMASVDAYSFPSQHQSVPYLSGRMTATPEMVQHYPLPAQMYSNPMQPIEAPRFDQQYTSPYPAPYQHQQHGLQNQYQQHRHQPYVLPSSLPNNALPNLQQYPQLNGYPAISTQRYTVNNQLQNQRVPPVFAPIKPYLQAQNIAQSSYPQTYVQQPYVPTQGHQIDMDFPNIGLAPPPSRAYPQLNRSDLIAGQSSQRTDNQQQQSYSNGMPLSNSHQIPCQQRRLNSAGNANNAQNNGNFMRDQRNDAPPTSELDVVSRLNGNLIVNPNLSTDDIEIDNSSYIDQREGSKSKPRADASSDSDASSDDSDEDILPLPVPPHKGRQSRGKTVNIVSCTNVQLGQLNRIVEQKKPKRAKKSLSSSKQPKLDSKTENPIVIRSTSTPEEKERHITNSTTEECQTGNSKLGQNTLTYKDKLSPSISSNLSVNDTNKPAVSQSKTVFRAKGEDKEKHLSTEKIISERRFVVKDPLQLNVSQRRGIDSIKNESDSEEDNDALPSDNVDRPKLFGNGNPTTSTNDRNDISGFEYSRRKQNYPSYVNWSCGGLRLESSSENKNSESELD